jgi:hypothetical protein
LLIFLPFFPPCCLVARLSAGPTKPQCTVLHLIMSMHRWHQPRCVVIRVPLSEHGSNRRNWNHSIMR